ncbi:MAG: DEAD/DEAH box helicase [Cyclobacteriaceae bacterium]
MLRRTKQKVAKELPDKTEDVIYCEMDKKQRKVYEAYRNEICNQIKNKIEEDGLNQSKMLILQALTKLRQICDSPAILSDEEDYGDESIKLEELIKHIQEKTGGHKLLVFSQFVKMLDVIKERLKQENIAFEYLDGKCSTSQREASVNNFQNNDEVRVFLISLKAGGTGLNLTAADYVYIVDPWWNPAVENQAIDRCYRIGQTKNVIAYRMICKDTIEEKIMQYKSKKEKVADSIISVDESIMKSLSQQDVTDLFG